MKTNCGILSFRFGCLLLLGAACVPSQLQAEPPWGITPTVEVTRAIVVDAKGTVTVDSGDAKMQAVKMQEGKPDKSVPALLSGLGATLRTGPDSEATIILPSAGLVRVSANTEVRLPVLSSLAAPAAVSAPGTAPGSSSGSSSTQSRMGRESLELLKGSLYLKIDPAEVKKRGHATFRLKTPAALLAVKGTEFFASSDGTTDTAGVHDGEIFVYEPVSDAFISLNDGNAVTVSSGMISEPRRLTPKERRDSANYKVTKIRQLVVVAKWDPLLAPGRTNFSDSNPFGTIHDIVFSTRGSTSSPRQDLLLDLSSVRGTPLAIQMLVQGGAGAPVPQAAVGKQLSPLENSIALLPLASSLKVQAGLSFALKAAEHQAPMQTIPLSGFFTPAAQRRQTLGAYQQTMTTVIFPLSAAPLSKLGRVRFVVEPAPTGLDEYKKVLALYQAQRWQSTSELSRVSGYYGVPRTNISGVQITGVSILVAD
jgi:FecR-like protein